jgi:hypothetical protein
MSSLPASHPVDLDEIRNLETALRDAAGAPGARAQVFPPELEKRRHALLARHLGFTPARQKAPLYVIGDSHAVFFAGAESIRFTKGRRVWTGFFRARYVSAFTELLPVFRVFHVGPATAWQVDEPASSTRAMEKISTLLRCGDVPRGSSVLLVFGEIDCRCHIPKAVLGGASVAAATNATIERFMRLPRRLQALGYTPSIWLPSLQPNQEGGTSDEKQPLPFVGPQSLRSEINTAYCDRLLTLCTAEGIRAAGLSPSYAGDPVKSFIDGHHLSQNMMPAALITLVQAGILPLASAPDHRPS